MFFLQFYCHHELELLNCISLVRLINIHRYALTHRTIPWLQSTLSIFLNFLSLLQNFLSTSCSCFPSPFSHTHTCPANVIFLSEQTQFIWFVVARVQCFIQQPFLRIYIFPTTAFFRFTLGCRNLLARNCCFAAVMILVSRHSDYIANSFKRNFFRREKKIVIRKWLFHCNGTIFFAFFSFVIRSEFASFSRLHRHEAFWFVAKFMEM